MLCPRPLHISHIADYVYDFCSDHDVGISVLACDVEHTSFHVGRYGRKCVLCLFCECPCLCTNIITDSDGSRGLITHGRLDEHPNMQYSVNTFVRTYENRLNHALSMVGFA